MNGEAITLADILDPNDDSVLEEIALESRGGFDTATTSGRLDLSHNIQGGTFSFDSDVSNYGFWGEYGYFRKKATIPRRQRA